ncbi:major facilitator superfamily domain-containing protein [Zychaea mexicana]|uniref:major facilitator superfamily domain-containing protein n=1 Tax=Zychaea mexicana TaxID=64656 RepID=UPI0022FF3C0C|nr:major facilitator superfamily domain-containing protein [Zychaea mexicana]KAI9498163.1 major facilitator superfamily domain-containing protein [Zychaea mexicana]
MSNDEKIEVNSTKGSITKAEVVAAEASSKDLNDKRIDPELAKYAGGEIIEVDEATNKRLKNMLFRRVLFIMTVTYFLQALDKGTLSFASIMNLIEDTNLVGQQYSWLTTCIYIAVLIVEYPINWIIQRVPIAKFLAFNILAWSTVLAFHAMCTNFVGLLVCRTLLGIFEASCQPTFVVLSSMWFKREEQAMIVTVWYMMNGFQQIVGGLLAYAFTHITSGPIKSWQALFITYGSFSFLWGIVVLLWMPDSPMRAKCYSEEDKKLLVERVRSNQTGLQNKTFRKEQFIEAFKDFQVYAYGLIAFLTTLPTSGLGAFANIIITGFGFSVLETQLLAMVLGAYIMFCLLSSSYITKRWGHTVLVMMAYVIPSVIGTIVLLAVENTNAATQAGLLMCYYLVLSFWATSTLSISLLSRNVGGQTKKSVAVAFNFICWAAGNAIGPQVFQQHESPRYFTGFAVHIVCYALLLLTLGLLRWHFIRQNRKKAEYLAERTEEQDKEGRHSFDDLTDVQNPNFVYIY